MARTLGEKNHGDTSSGVGEQPGRDDPDGGQQGGVGGRDEGLHDDELASQVEGVPSGGLNREVGDLDAEADPDHDATGDDGHLPGRVGGGLAGG